MGAQGIGQSARNAGGVGDESAWRDTGVFRRGKALPDVQRKPESVKVGREHRRFRGQGRRAYRRERQRGDRVGMPVSRAALRP